MTVNVSSGGLVGPSFPLLLYHQLFRYCLDGWQQRH
nr:MAG TPA: hypothetical protein [Caudoviricetes sp.]